MTTRTQILRMKKLRDRGFGFECVHYANVRRSCGSISLVTHLRSSQPQIQHCDAEGQSMHDLPGQEPCEARGRACVEGKAV